MKLLKDNFFEGPNIWGPQSGLLGAIGIGKDDAALLAWKPEPAAMESVLDALRRAFAVPPGSAQLANAAAFAASPAPFADLVLATTEFLSRDFCLRPGRGRVVQSLPKRMLVFVPCDEQPVGHAGLQLAVGSVAALVRAGSQRPPGTLRRLRELYLAYLQVTRTHGLNQASVALAREAIRRGIPVQRFAPPAQFLQLGQGALRKRIHETSTDDDSDVANRLASDRFAFAGMLQAQGLPTAQPVLAGTAGEAIAAWRMFGGPVVVKPRGAGQGPALDLRDEAAVAAAFEQASPGNASPRGVIVERFVEGTDHRLLVVGGRLVAAAGSVVAPRAAASLSVGETAKDVTDAVHPDNRAMAERVARLTGLGTAGIDFLTPDISKSWRDVACAVLAVNGAPGLRPHMAANDRRNVARPVVGQLFPGNATGRLPTAGITGSVGKTTTTQMVGAILAQAGFTTAVSTTQGAFIGNELLKAGDLSAGSSAKRLMLDPSVQAGAFELARGALVKRGMYLDAVEVGAVLNIFDNHVGLDGIRDREQLARVKRLVVENARRMAVLNADEPLCLAMRDHVRVPVCLFSEHPDNAAVAAHVAAGGTAAWISGAGADAAIRLCEGQRVVGEIAVRDIPVAWHGAYRPGWINAMGAAAIAHGLGVPFAAIEAALRAFQSTEGSNPGRMNFVTGHPYQLLVTWCDGKAPIAELARFARTVACEGRRRLMFCGVGNRSDDFLVAMGAAAAGGFDDFVVSDWEDLRGRPPGEAAGLLARGLVGEGVPAGRIAIVPDHGAGLKAAFDATKPGDLLVFATFISDKERRAIPALAAA